MICLKSRIYPTGGSSRTLLHLVGEGAGDGNRTRVTCLEGTSSPRWAGLIANPSDSKTGVKPGWNRGGNGPPQRNCRTNGPIAKPSLQGDCGRNAVWQGLSEPVDPIFQPLPHTVRRAELLVGPRRLLRVVGRRVPPRRKNGYESPVSCTMRLRRNWCTWGANWSNSATRLTPA